MWRAARSIREQLVKQGEAARQICATSYGGEPTRVSGKELTAQWPETSSEEAVEKTPMTVGDKDAVQPVETDLPEEDAPITPSEVWSVRLLQVFPDCIMLQAQALRILGTLSFQNDIFRRKVGEQQGLFHIIQTMRRHFHTSDNVVLYGATALTNLCHSSNENRSRFLEYDGASLILDIMRFYFGDNGDITNDPQHERDSDNPTAEEADDAKSKMKIAASRPKISQATQSRILCQCCYVILTVAGGSEVALAQRIVDEEGDELILRCLSRFRDDAELQQYGLWALYNLAIVTPTIAENIASLGAVEYCQMIADIYTASVAIHPKAYSEVVRQAHATLQVLLKTAVAVNQANQNKADDVPAADSGNGSMPAAGKGKAKSSANNLILPAINIYSATQTVVTNHPQTANSAKKKKATASSASNNLLSKSASHL